MSDQITDNKKATGFADAVKALLGLDAIDKAVYHLNPGRTLSVIGSYESEYDSNNNKEIKNLTKWIQEYTADINRAGDRINELQENISNMREKLEQKKEEIKQFEEGEKLQNEKDKLLREIKFQNEQKENIISDICANFNKEMGTFFSTLLMKDSLSLLEGKDFTGKDIPSINKKTIEYLLEHGTCICGKLLIPETEAYRNVADLINYLPPQSISTTVADLKKGIRKRANALDDDMYGEIKKRIKNISRQNKEIRGTKEDLEIVEKQLGSGNVTKQVRQINEQIQYYRSQINRYSQERDSKIQEKGGLEAKLNAARNRREKLALKDTNNRKIEIYKAYAQKIYEDLQQTYSKSESMVREVAKNY